MDEKRFKYNFGIFGIFLIIIFASFFISLFISSLAFSNAFIFSILVCFVVIIPIVVIGFIIFILIQRTKYAKYVTNRNVQIIALIISIFIIGTSIFFYYEYSAPSGIIKWWSCENGQILCDKQNNSYSGFNIFRDSTYNYRYGHLNFITNNYSGSFDFEWNYDKLSNIITIFYTNYSYHIIPTPDEPPLGFEWEVKLRLEIINENKMLTHYISQDNAPFNAELFDGITWVAIWE